VKRTAKRQWLGVEGYAWVLHRLTGLALVAFLLMHLYTLSSVRGGEAAFDRTMIALQRPLPKIGELMLLWAILFHGLNGLRLILINVLPGINHKIMAYGVFALTVAGIFISIPVVF
jgi:succinate dehydrogenase / fumarate reductase cytochrome b subunit